MNNLKKAVIVNLGCKVNQYEGDCIASILNANDYEVTFELSSADLYVLNSCAVTKEAERKSRQYISKIKKISPNAKIIVAGCASEFDSEQFLSKGVDRIIGTFGKPNILEEISKVGLYKYPKVEEYERFLLPPLKNRTRINVKIQDGCDNFCSYCIIPYLRGRSRSRRISEILCEINDVRNFTREIILTGINISDFGKDTEENINFLLEELDKLDLRIRFGSIYAEMITDEFLQQLFGMKSFCPHFHLSLQSGSNRVLKDMNRKYNVNDYKDKIGLIKKYFSNASITTDIIVGYPTEDDESFNETLHFVNEIAFSDVHIFKFSARKGTKAAGLKLLPAKIIEKRKDLLENARNVSREEFLLENIGVEHEVLIEQSEGNILYGYSKNYIKIYCNTTRKINDIVKVKCIKIYKDGLFATESI